MNCAACCTCKGKKNDLYIGNYITYKLMSLTLIYFTKTVVKKVYIVDAGRDHRDVTGTVPNKIFLTVLHTHNIQGLPAQLVGRVGLTRTEKGSTNISE